MLESLDGRRALYGAKAQIKELRARHQMIMRLHLVGVSQKDIARILEITPQMVSIVQNSDIYKAEFVKMQAATNEKAVEDAVDIRKRIEALAGQSLTVLEEILRDAMTDDKLRADVAFDILDRGGYRAAQKVDHTVNFGQTVQNAYNRRKEIRAAEAVVETTALPAPGQDETTTDEVSDEDSTPQDDSTALVVSSTG